MEPVLVIDIGNSSTTVARYSAGNISRVSSLRGGITDSGECCAAAVRAAAHGPFLRGAMVASVVPNDTPLWRDMIVEECGVEPMFLDYRCRLPMLLDYDHPETTGADRLANVAGAIARYGAPLLVIDIGTAVTYELVAADRRFFTGVIGPGPDIMARALSDYTALLPVVNWWLEQPPALPKDTKGAMQYGIEAAFVGTLRETILRLTRLFEESPRIVATGGFAERFAKPLNLDIIVDPDLTIFGLGWLFEHQGNNNGQ